MKKKDKIEKKAIEAALRNNWALSRRKIRVTVSGSDVTLTGVVHSVYQKGLASNIARIPAEVRSVENDLFVDYAYSVSD